MVSTENIINFASESKNSIIAKKKLWTKLRLNKNNKVRTKMKKARMQLHRHPRTLCLLLLWMKSQMTIVNWRKKWKKTQTTTWCVAVNITWSITSHWSSNFFILKKKMKLTKTFRKCKIFNNWRMNKSRNAKMLLSPKSYPMIIVQMKLSLKTWKKFWKKKVLNGLNI